MRKGLVTLALAAGLAGALAAPASAQWGGPGWGGPGY
ncbi:MAG TPA: sulfur globule protein, partial [Rhodobacterales bacterium]|nr:sulfur globule protein [Rhodobacterales bacterium]